MKEGDTVLVAGRAVSVGHAEVGVDFGGTWLRVPKEIVVAPRNERRERIATTLYPTALARSYGAQFQRPTLEEQRAEAARDAIEEADALIAELDKERG